MAKVVVLGGCGGIGRVAVRALAVMDTFATVVVADLDGDDAAALAASVGGGCEGTSFDATDRASVAEVLTGADVVLNCVGPFYRFGPPLLRAAIAAGVDYVDVCDDLLPTREMLALDAEARAAGVRALIGMGNSPGLANVLVRLCDQLFLDEVRSVDIMHIHGGEPEEGAAVVHHRIHAMTHPVPLFVDGTMVEVMQLEESGRAHTVETEFRDLGTYPVYPYPHPETITLPEHFPTLRRATNLGVIFPLSYFHLTQDMVRLGTCTEEPLEVQGRPVVPLEFAVAHIRARRAELLREAGVTGPAGCLKVVVGGTKAGAEETYVFSLSSRSAGAGEGTGIPAAVGAALMGQKRVYGEGVFPPEAGVAPLDVILMAMGTVKKLGLGGADSIHVERVDAQGNASAVPLPF